MSNRYEWTKPAYGTCADTCLLVAEADGARIELHAEYYDGEVHASMVVFDDGNAYSTDDPAEWTDVERFIPRNEWPEQIYAGKKKIERKPDEAVRDALREFWAEEAETLVDDALQESEKLNGATEETDEAGANVIIIDEWKVVWSMDSEDDYVGITYTAYSKNEDGWDGGDGDGYCIETAADAKHAAELILKKLPPFNN